MKSSLFLAAALISCIAAAVGPKVGDPAPGFSLQDQTGTTRSLADYKGKWVALAFYPKDMTPGCTVQNRSFSAEKQKFDELGINVLAISVDTVDSHKQFCEKDKLVHTLLADANGDVATAYGVRGASGFASRTTFMIDPQGKIAQVYEKVIPGESAGQIVSFVQQAKGIKTDAAPDFKLLGSDDKEYSLSALKPEKGVLLLFIATRCPVSRAYDERMNKIADGAKAKGFLVLGINSNENEPSEEVKDHAGHMKFVVLKDPGSKVADLYKAKVTPEAFLILPNQKIAYHGRVDDSMEESQITRNDLVDAINAVAQGKLILIKETQAFGCGIKRPKK